MRAGKTKMRSQRVTTTTGSENKTENQVVPDSKIRRRILSRIKNSLVSFLGLMALIVAASAVIPVNSQGQAIQQPQEVTIINSAKNPAPVRDVDNARQPFQLTATNFVPKGDSGNVKTIFTVPDGKRLVIETISARAELALVDTPNRVEVLTKSELSTAFHEILVLKQGLNLNGQDVYVGTHYMRAYAEPGTDVVFQFTRSNVGNDAPATVTITGYFVDLP